MPGNRSSKTKSVRGTGGRGVKRSRQDRAGSGSERGSNGGSRYAGERRTQEPRGRRNLVKRVGSTVSEKVGGMDVEKALVLLHAGLALALVVKQARRGNRPRKAEPFRSAMSVLSYYLNEGRELSETQRATLEDIKEELRKLYKREDDEMISPAGR